MFGEWFMKRTTFKLSFFIPIVVCVIVFAANQFSLRANAQDAAQDQAPPADAAQAPSPETAAPPADQPQPSHLSQQQLQELVAPIALYPDALVAQILAASAYPTQIVEAERFLQQNPELKGKELGDAVDKQDWDPSVKALCQFPTVLANMDKDLTWTSELGDANVNQQADVMNAIQYMRHQAKKAGHLDTTQQQTVTEEGDDIDIAPTDPNVVYVPVYDPGLIYGYPVGLWPGFYPWWGVGGPLISFGVGFGIGPFFGFGWGWPAWGFDWYHHGLIWGGHPYAWHSHAFYDRNAYFHGAANGYRGGFRAGEAYGRGDRGMRGWGGARAPAARGAFGGFDRGGDTRGFASRGRSSFGGGGFHGGGGGRR
jgi:uncharacterized membrane protein YgcG